MRKVAQLAVFSSDQDTLSALWQTAGELQAGEELEISIFGGDGCGYLGTSACQLLRGLTARGVITRAYAHHAHSSGVFWLCGCSERIGFPATTVMLHDANLEGFEGGKASSREIKDCAAQVALMEELRDQILSETTGQPKELFAAMTARGECWIDAETALGYGILTAIERYDRPAAIELGAALGAHLANRVSEQKSVNAVAVVS